MKKKVNLHNLATRNAVLLERLKSGYSREMVKTLNKAIKQTEDYLRSQDADTLKGSVSFRELQQDLRDLRAGEIEVLYEGINRQVEEFGLLAGQQTLQEGSLLQSLTTKFVKIPSAEKAFAEVLKNPLGVNGELLEPFMKTWADGTVTRVNQLLTKGWNEGQTIQQMVRGLIGTKKGNYADGLIVDERRNANAIVRTATAHVANSSRMGLYQANPKLVQTWEFVATLDNVTSATCRSLDGQKFPVGEGPMPPRHPHCRSSHIPVLGPEFDIFDEGATRSSSGGYVDADLTYYDWLKKQDDAFQDVALGKSRATLFRDGGLSSEDFRKLNLNSSFEPLTLKQMQEIAPEAFKSAGLLQ